MLIRLFVLLLSSSFAFGLVEVKAGYFFFTDCEMRQVYDRGGIDVQLTGTYPIYNFLELYGSIEYLRKHGYSINAHEKTKLWAVPLNFGLRTFYPITDCFKGYITVGPRYIFVHVNNGSLYVPKTMQGNGCGGFLNGGLLYRFYNNFILDVFAEYSYKPLQFCSSQKGTIGHRAQVGGVTIGGGIGTNF